MGSESFDVDENVHAYRSERVRGYRLSLTNVNMSKVVGNGESRGVELSKLSQKSGPAERRWVRSGCLPEQSITYVI